MCLRIFSIVSQIAHSIFKMSISYLLDNTKYSKNEKEFRCVIQIIVPLFQILDKNDILPEYVFYTYKISSVYIVRVLDIDGVRRLIKYW